MSFLGVVLEKFHHHSLTTPMFSYGFHMFSYVFLCFLTLGVLVGIPLGPGSGPPALDSGGPGAARGGPYGTPKVSPGSGGEQARPQKTGSSITEDALRVRPSWACHKALSRSRILKSPSEKV